MHKSSKLNNVKSMYLSFTMHSSLKLLQQQTIFVSASSRLDANSVFNSLLFILYATSLELRKAFLFRFECFWSHWIYFAKSVNEFSFILCVFKVLFIGFTLNEHSIIWVVVLVSLEELQTYLLLLWLCNSMLLMSFLVCTSY